MAGLDAIAGVKSPFAAGSSAVGAGGTSARSRLRPEDLAKLQRLQARDRELRLAHADPSRLQYETGPDGRRYASVVADDPGPRTEAAPSPTVDPQVSDAPSTEGGLDAGTVPVASTAEESTSDSGLAGDPGQALTGAGTTTTAKKKKQRSGLRLPELAYHPLTPAALLRQARVEAAYLAQAATPPRINVTA